MTMEYLKISLFLIVGAFHNLSTASALEPKASSLPVTTSSKVSGALRDVLNQESLLRLSMVQTMQSLSIDAVDFRTKTVVLTENLKTVTQEMKMLKAENQKQKEELAVLKEAQVNMNEDIRHIRMTEPNTSSELLYLKQKYLNFSLAVNKTLEKLRDDQSASDVQLMNITSQILSAERTRCESGTRLPGDHGIHILFNNPFEETPSVTYGFVALDLFSGNPYQIGPFKSYVDHGLSNLTRSGFSISSNIRRSSIGASVKISWMACGKVHFIKI